MKKKFKRLSVTRSKVLVILLGLTAWQKRESRPEKFVKATVK